VLVESFFFKSGVLDLVP